MEIIQEDHCSHGAVRLTCRSLKAFIFILEAEYLSNLTGICGYDLQKLIEKKMYKSRSGSSYKKKGLKGNYIDDADEERFGLVDVRQSLNKRYVVECDSFERTGEHYFLKNSDRKFTILTILKIFKNRIVKLDGLDWHLPFISSFLIIFIYYYPL